MAAGVAVAAFALGGLPELVTDGVDGLPAPALLGVYKVGADLQAGAWTPAPRRGTLGVGKCREGMHG
jgi:hypothetical protein